LGGGGRGRANRNESLYASSVRKATEVKRKGKRGEGGKREKIRRGRRGQGSFGRYIVVDVGKFARKKGKKRNMPQKRISSSSSASSVRNKRGRKEKKGGEKTLLKKKRVQEGADQSLEDFLQHS